MATARELTAEQLASYRAAARQRHEAEQRALTLRAMERVHDLSQEIPINLVDLAACSESLRHVIEREGQPV